MSFSKKYLFPKKIYRSFPRKQAMPLFEDHTLFLIDIYFNNNDSPSTKFCSAKK